MKAVFFLPFFSSLVSPTLSSLLGFVCWRGSCTDREAGATCDWLTRWFNLLAATGYSIRPECSGRPSSAVESESSRRTVFRPTHPILPREYVEATSELRTKRGKGRIGGRADGIDLFQHPATVRRGHRHRQEDSRLLFCRTHEA